MLTITVEPQCGQYIGDAVREAASLADKLDVCVDFKFNGVPMFVLPHDIRSVEKISKEYFDGLKRSDDAEKAAGEDGKASEESCSA